MFPGVRYQLLAGVSNVYKDGTRLYMDLHVRTVDRSCVERRPRNNVSCWDRYTCRNVEWSISVKHLLLQTG
jgi:hypothetical protein